jgi:hypothetical protein
MGLPLPSRYSMVINDMKIERLFVDEVINEGEISVKSEENIEQKAPRWDTDIAESPAWVVKSDAFTMLKYLKEVMYKKEEESKKLI